MILAPLVELKRDDLERVRKERITRYAYVPGVSSVHGLAADLDRMMTVEKSILSKLARTAGWETPEEGRAIARAIARKFGRPAFPDGFVERVEPLRRRLHRKAGKNSDEGRAIAALREVRVLMDEPEPGCLGVTFLFILEADAAHLLSQVEAHACGWMELLPQEQGVVLRCHRVVTLDRLDAEVYVHSDRLDFDHLSLPEPPRRVT